MALSRPLFLFFMRAGEPIPQLFLNIGPMASEFIAPQTLERPELEALGSRRRRRRIEKKGEEEDEDEEKMK